MAENRLGINNSEKKLIGNGAPRPGTRASSQPKNEFFVGNTNEKRYLWTARAFAVITAISICCNLVLIIAITQVIPLFRVEPFLLTFQNKQEQVINIVPIKNDMEKETGITEVFVRQYILLRSSFTRDIPEMESRWMPGGALQEMSDRAVYEEFLRNTANRALQIIRTRQPRDMYPDSKSPDVNYWTASLRIVYRHKTVKYGERLKNPVGFTVVRYALSHNKVNTTK